MKKAIMILVLVAVLVGAGLYVFTARKSMMSKAAVTKRTHVTLSKVSKTNHVRATNKVAPTKTMPKTVRSY